MRTGLAGATTLPVFVLPRFSDMLLSPLSFLAGSVGCPSRFIALDLLPILGNPRCTEAAHRFSHLFFLLYVYLILICDPSSKSRVGAGAGRMGGGDASPFVSADSEAVATQSRCRDG